MGVTRVQLTNQERGWAYRQQWVVGVYSIVSIPTMMTLTLIKLIPFNTIIVSIPNCNPELNQYQYISSNILVDLLLIKFVTYFDRIKIWHNARSSKRNYSIYFPSPNQICTRFSCKISQGNSCHVNALKAYAEHEICSSLFSVNKRCYVYFSKWFLPSYIADFRVIERIFFIFQGSGNLGLNFQRAADGNWYILYKFIS